MLETHFLEKFGNSLKLRMGIRIADVPAMSAKAQAITAISGGVFTSNADNAALQYSSAPLILIQYGLI
jgi:hypothetical protein